MSALNLVPHHHSPLLPNVSATVAGRPNVSSHRPRPAAELENGPRRGGDELVVIGIDEVRLDVLKPGQAAEIGERHGVVEQKLVRNRVDRPLLRYGDVAVGLEVGTIEFGMEFDAFVPAFFVVEST